ncbi:MAG: type II toxin-antitoxin system VapC family toxin [Firmicutes bacterium]|nr:type II toxin-antitoxin system VapC family toxin [Bacillota bacterium]
MITALDTNILLDILIPNTDHCQSSKVLLDMSLQKGALIICEMVYAELAAQFGRKDALDDFLLDSNIQLYPSTVEILHLAGLKWSEYATRRAKTIICPACGSSLHLNCPTCQRTQLPRQHILADFIIGAHALLQADGLLTRDRGYYKTYFPELRLIE